MSEKNGNQRSKPDAPEDLRNPPLLQDDGMAELDAAIEKLEYHLEEANKLLGFPPLEPL
jgi:hypothetical protein